jgi:hypothetical protein
VKRIAAAGLASLLALTALTAASEPDPEQLLARALERIGPVLELPPGLRPAIWVAAATAEFTARTGAPPFAAGRYFRGTIHLQPLALLRQRGILEQTVAHETVHFCLERLAGPGCPRWLAEGLAQVLAAGEKESAEPEEESGAPAPPTLAAIERDLASRHWQTARIAQSYATARVRCILGKWGLPALVEALKRGRTGDWRALTEIGDDGVPQEARGVTGSRTGPSSGRGPLPGGGWL